jgi:uracil DNA glycosylase
MESPLLKSFHNYKHSNYNKSITNTLLLELENNVRPSLSEVLESGKNISPQESSLIMRFLEQDPKNQRGIILGMDPYLHKATGIPFEDIGFNQSSRNICSNIKRIYDLQEEAYTGLNLYRLQSTHNITLLNACPTITRSKFGEPKTPTGDHFSIWNKFMTSVICYILRKSIDCRFILIFGKDQRLSELVDHCISETSSECIKIVSYNPCMSSYFLNENSNPFQEVNALMNLHNEEPIPWYITIDEYSTHDYLINPLSEVRILSDDISLYSLYNKSASIHLEICNLDDYKALLGDNETSIIEYVENNSKLVTSLYKLYNKSFTEFKRSIKGLSSSVARRVDIHPPSSIKRYVCSFKYSRSSVTFFLRSSDEQVYSFVIPPLDYFFYKKYGHTPVTGFFKLSVTEKDMIPLNAYECLIDIIFSKTYRFHQAQMSYQLLKKAVIINEEDKIQRPTYYFPDQDFTNLRYQNKGITCSGLMYRSYLINSSDDSSDESIPNIYNSTYITNKTLAIHESNVTIISYLVVDRNSLLEEKHEDVIILRNLSPPTSNKKETIVPITGSVNNLFSVLLFIHKSYTKASKAYINNPNISASAVFKEYIMSYRNRVIDISVFDLCLSLYAVHPPKDVLPLIENVDVVSVDPYPIIAFPLNQSKIESLDQRIIRLENTYDDAVNKKDVQDKISILSQERNELMIATVIASLVNKTFKLFNKYGATI